LHPEEIAANFLQPIGIQGHCRSRLFPSLQSTLSDSTSIRTITGQRRLSREAPGFKWGRRQAVNDIIPHPCAFFPAQRLETKNPIRPVSNHRLSIVGEWNGKQS
jgi:hypothetical protein